MWRILGHRTGSEPSFVGQFKNFVAPHGSIIDLAVYGAFYTLASALVDNIILPFMDLFSIGSTFSTISFTLKEPVYGPHGETVHQAIVLSIGSFLQALLNFFLVALIFFVIARFCSAVCQWLYHFFGRSFEKNSLNPVQGLPPDSLAQNTTKIDEKSQEELLVEIRDLLRQLNTKHRISVK